MKAHTEKDLEDAQRTKEYGGTKQNVPIIGYTENGLDNYDDYPQYSEDLYYLLKDFGITNAPRLHTALERYIRNFVTTNDINRISLYRYQLNQKTRELDELKKDYHNLSKQNYELVQRFRLLLGEL